MSESPRPLLLPRSSLDSVPDSDVGRLLGSVDWAATPLGPMDGWPQSLRIALTICLNSRFPMFVWWGDERINLYNDAYIPMLGKRHPDAFGKPAQQTWADIWDVVGEQSDRVFKTAQATWNERVLLVMERNGYPENTYFTWSYSPIFDEEGMVRGMFCAVSEDTAWVAAEAERDRLLREATSTVATLKAWFDQAPGFVALLRGPDFVFEMANEAYYQLVGHRDLVGRPVFEALPDIRNQGYEQLLNGVYNTGERFVGRELRVEVQESPGSEFKEKFVDLVYQPVHDATGAVSGIFVQGHDVSEQVHAANALKEASRRKDEFLATLAHELRNPLAPIRQAAAVARSPKADAARRSWAMEVVDRQAGHMAVLLDDLLDASRISRGKLELRVRGAVLQEIVNAAVETAQPLVTAKQHTLKVELPDQPVPVEVDPVRVAQVISNLLSNAAKYTDTGGTITVKAVAEQGHLRISVHDNGIGLAPESQAGIFDMFSQVTSALHRSEGGLGIGLALSRGLVELHRGTLEVKSGGIGKGSEFIISLPWESAKAGLTIPIRTSSAMQPRTILVADDNEDALETLAILLSLDGHQVLKAPNGRQALHVAESQRPDLAILDVGMPDFNGYQLARQIRGSVWGARMPLIALTGWGQSDDIQAARDAGFSEHLTKPADPETIRGLLRKWLVTLP